MEIGLYIHIPFCARKCPYCDFYSVRYDSALVAGYVSAVMRNISAYADRYGKLSVGTVYFGGGTPSLLSPAYIDGILSCVREKFSLSPDAEVTMECNPTLSDREKLSAYRKSGVNRISFGVQSFDDNELEFLGRLHTADNAVRAIENAHRAGFDRISADLMLGIQGQTTDSIAGNIAMADKLPIEHISAYMLKIEEGTPFDCDKVRAEVPSDEKTADFYLFATELLEKAGFLQYEISNFAKQEGYSRHNLLYWKCDDYVGIGASAHSCFGGTRYAVPGDIQRFIDADFQVEEVTDDSPCGFEEYAMLRLRLTEGLFLGECRERFGTDTDALLKKAEIFRKNGLLTTDNGRIALTKRGFLVSNGIIAQLVL